jgi:hypothetical protein
MIVVENMPDGRTHTYSDSGFKIMQETGAIYEDAVDTVPHTYTETDIPIEGESAEEIVSILLGGDE